MGRAFILNELPQDLKEKFTEDKECKKISKKLMQIPFFQKIFNYEMITYVFYGVVTTVINYISYWLLCLAFSIPMSNVSPKQNILSVVANTIAFIISLVFAFVTNKIIVFGSRDYSLITIFNILLIVLFFYIEIFKYS